MWVLVAGVVLVGGYGVVKNKSGEVSNQAEQTDNKAPVYSAETGKKMAFSQFVKQGGSYKCEVKQYLSDFENTGTVYLSDGNMRGEFSTVAEGKTMDTSFIFKDEYMYSWSSALPNMGFKMKVNPTVANTDTKVETSGTYSWNADQIGDYNCEIWATDSSKFALPSGVTFQDFSNKQ